MALLSSYEIEFMEVMLYSQEAVQLNALSVATNALGSSNPPSIAIQKVWNWKNNLNNGQYFATPSLGASATATISLTLKSQILIDGIVLLCISSGD